jgi:hypothetical protein
MAKNERQNLRGEKTVENKNGSYRVLTKAAMIISNYRITPEERDLMIAACRYSGESRSEFLRRACRQRAAQILSRERDNETAVVG